MVFMLAAGTNFLIHYHVWRGNFKVLKDEEFRLYWVFLALATTLLILSQGFGSYRYGLFQAISIMTGTGFFTADFGSWHFGARMVLLLLMFIGACGGSTGGGIKVVRTLILLKHSRIMMTKILSPNAVIPVKYNRKALSEGIIRDIIAFVFLYFIVFIVASVALGFLGLDVETAISAVATCQANCGPGLGEVGPVFNYFWLPVLGKIVLAIVMWLGRLEIFTVIMMFFPRYWKG
jgi:trk system potassium uptake protein TrkH